jgi:hypothetical protein
MTDIKELTQSPELGKHLGLVPDGLLPELEEQFGKRLGRERRPTPSGLTTKPFRLRSSL